MLGDKVWLVFQFIPKVLDGVDVRALCRLVEFFHIKLRKPYYHVETGKEHPQTVATN